MARLHRVGDIMAGFDERNTRKCRRKSSKCRTRSSYSSGRRSTMLQMRNATEKPCAEIGQFCLTIDRLEVGLENQCAVTVGSAFSGAMGRLARLAIVCCPIFRATRHNEHWQKHAKTGCRGETDSKHNRQRKMKIRHGAIPVQRCRYYVSLPHPH
jgi:hypothetical protein